jgi:hypothetical protein
MKIVAELSVKPDGPGIAGAHIKRALAKAEGLEKIFPFGEHCSSKAMSAMGWLCVHLAVNNAQGDIIERDRGFVAKPEKNLSATLPHASVKH